MRIAIVGRRGGTHLGESLAHAAAALGHEARLFDAAEADAGPSLVRSVAWRLDHRPLALERFSAKVAAECERAPPRMMLTTGQGMLTAEALERLRRVGVATVNFSTDDPWNPGQRARWHLAALPRYDIVFTPRRANIDDLARLGCADVRYLPFGYDERHAFPPPAAAPPGDLRDVLFVGGGDRDRAGFVEAFLRSGPEITLVGGFWDRFAATRALTVGLKRPEDLRVLTAAAKVNLCLVRRANRDGHVMRSLEIGAIGGCMLAEDTAEHRALFGEDSECVVYFRDPAQAADRARRLVGDPAERRRLAGALHARVTGGAHTYRHRLETMLAAVAPSLRPVAQAWNNRNGGPPTRPQV